MCMQVWGFDIMLDSSLRAWLIEVNTCPALNSDSPLDKHLKTSMVSDLMNLVGACLGWWVLVWNGGLGACLDLKDLVGACLGHLFVCGVLMIIWC